MQFRESSCQGQKKKCSEGDVKVAVGRISGGGWTVYKVSKKSHNILKERLLIFISGANSERGNAVST
jgi:DNA gyrase inhibitor GyrI